MAIPKPLMMAQMPKKTPIEETPCRLTTVPLRRLMFEGRSWMGAARERCPGLSYSPRSTTEIPSPQRSLLPLLSASLTCSPMPTGTPFCWTLEEIQGPPVVRIGSTGRLNGALLESDLSRKRASLWGF